MLFFSRSSKNYSESIMKPGEMMEKGEKPEIEDVILLSDSSAAAGVFNSGTWMLWLGYVGLWHDGVSNLP
jgi:hypothetical protein